MELIHTPFSMWSLSASLEHWPHVHTEQQKQTVGFWGSGTLWNILGSVQSFQWTQMGHKASLWVSFLEVCHHLAAFKKKKAPYPRLTIPFFCSYSICKVKWKQIKVKNTPQVKKTKTFCCCLLRCWIKVNNTSKGRKICTLKSKRAESKVFSPCLLNQIYLVRSC